MYKQLSIIDVLKAVRDRVETDTDYVCYVDMPVNEKSPLYFAELIGTRPVKSKTMFRTEYTVYIHVIDEPHENKSTAGLYKMIEALEEALTTEISVPKEYNLIMQINDGLVQKQLDETNEWHAIIAFRFDVCYGFKMK